MVDAWASPEEPTVTSPPPDPFAPAKLGPLTLRNRIVKAATFEGLTPAHVVSERLIDFHRRIAAGGVGMTTVAYCAISDEGCGTPNEIVLTREAVPGLRKIADAVHAEGAAISAQIGHAGPVAAATGRKGLAPSPIFSPMAMRRMRAVTERDIARITREFADAARVVADGGFDAIELHLGHGYLLSAFLSPLTNRRADAYGGSLENRCRWPLEVFRAMRAAWPADRPMSVRISAHDWAPGGNTPDDAVAMARLFRDAGADLIDVSSGQTTREAAPVYGRMYQTPFADRIRNEVGIATMAVGAIFEPDHVNSILMAGRADLCALGRPHLADPYWTLHAAARLGYDAPWPPQYLSGKAQLERNLARAAVEAAIVPEANG